MVCKITLYHDTVYSGLAQTYTSSTRNLTDNKKPFNKNYASWQKVEADESCAITAYTYPEFNYDGGTVSNQQTQRSVITREGEDNIYNQSGGVGSTGRNFNDDYDSIRIQTVPSAGANEMQHHINAISQVPLNATDPKSIGSNDMVYYDKTNKVKPCPGGTAYFNSKSGVRCIYPKSAVALRTLNGATKASNMDTMYTSLVDTFCADTENVFENPGGGTCLERSAGRAVAIEYCSVGSRIKGSTTGGDPNCSADSTSLGDSYGTVAAAYCEANPNDSFCSCYNVVNDKCADDSTTGPAGCDHKSGEAYVNNRKATPSDQKSLWDGQRKCGSVCTGADKYLPDNNQAGCKTTIQICSQTFNVNNMKNSDISASCELNASDGSSVGDSPSAPSPAQESAQTELEEAEAAVARGDPGAQERLDAAREALEAAEEPPSLTDFQNNPKAYIPKSLDGLKNNKKQQIGGGITGALILGCMMMLLLLVVGASGGGGGPVKRRFR